MFDSIFKFFKNIFKINRYFKCCNEDHNEDYNVTTDSNLPSPPKHCYISFKKIT